MVALKKTKQHKSKTSQNERIMLCETSIRLGKNSNPMRKITNIDNKVLYRTKKKSIYNTVPADVMHTVQFSFYIL